MSNTTGSPLKNRSGTPASISSSNLGHPQDAIVIEYDMTHQPYPVDDWHGPLKGPIRPLGSDPSNQVARWQHGDWDFTGWEGSSTDHYLVRKGTALAVELGLDPYPDHTPPELPSPWHRWEYQGTQVSGVQPPWYSVVEVVGDAGVSDIQRVGPSAGIPGFHYFQAVTDAPMLCVNGIWFPEPQRESLKRGQEYFVPAPTSVAQCSKYWWDFSTADKRLLSLGLIHLTAEAAKAHARAMLSLAEARDIVNS